MTDKKIAPLFVIDASPTIKWPVIVSLPADGGEQIEYQFTGVFKRLSEEAMYLLLGEGKTISPDEGGVAVTAGKITKSMQEILRENAELLPKLLTGWEGVKNALGEDATFSVERLKTHIVGVNGPFISTGLWRAIAEIRNGARLGN